MTAADRERLREQLRRDEGLRLMPYRDTTGHLSIGYGRNLDASGISSGEAEVLLDSDLLRAEDHVRAAMPWAERLDAARLGVLVNMTFNLGPDGVAGFRRMLRALERGDHAGAAREMLGSLWAGQVGDRATRLARQMEDGTWA